MSNEDGQPPPDRKLPHSHRPRSGSETRKRGGFVAIRGTDAELADIRAAAARCGLTVSSYGRAQMLAAPVTRTRHSPTIERELLARAVAMLGRAIGSLHQISKHLNFANVEYAADLPAAIAELRAAIAVNMAAAGYSPQAKDDREDAA